MKCGLPYRGEEGRLARLKLLVCCLGAVLLQGCAHISTEVQPDAPPAGAAMPLSSQALSKVEKWSAGVQAGHDQVAYTRQTLGVLSFGLASGAAVGAVMQNSAAAIRNLSLGAGLSYAGAALFVPNEEVRLYNSATRALVCIRSRAAGLLANVNAQAALLPTQSPDVVLNRVYPSGCAADAASKAAYAKASSAYRRARSAVDQARMSDSVIAAKVEDAARNVIVTLNEQLDALAPSQDAILASAKSSVVIAASLSPAAPPIAAAAAPAFGCVAPSPAQQEELRIDLERQSVTFAAVETAISQQINAVGALDSACTLSPAQVAPVTLSNEEVTLSKDAHLVLPIRGGVEPYYWTAVDTPPPAELSVQIIGSNLLLTAKSTAAAATYTIAVHDRSAIPNSAKLKITVN